MKRKGFQLRRAGQKDSALADFREDLFIELRKLIRSAITQAKKKQTRPPPHLDQIRPVKAAARGLTRYSR